MPAQHDEPALDDPDNAEWTDEDFARARGPESMPPEMLAAFPKTREVLARLGRPAGPAGPKVSVTLRLSPDVLAAFKSTGRFWQTRIDQALRDHLARLRERTDLDS